MLRRRAGFRTFNLVPLEAICWFGALLVLAFSPAAPDHISICPFNYAGLDFCPGCGLGRSISLFFRGDVSGSLSMHPLGIFAVIVLSFRIVKLTSQHIRNYGKSN